MCGVATIPFVIWYSKQRREWARRISSGCQSSSFNIAVTLDILSCWLVTHMAARRCTFSSVCFCLVTRGSHTEAAYSKCGRTSVFYSFSPVFIYLALTFIRMKPS